MTNPRQPVDKWHFSGDEAMHNTGHATAVSDKSSDYPDIYDGVVRLTLTSAGTGHGYKVSPEVYGPKPPNLIFINGTTNYDGLRKIVAVGQDTVDVVAKFVAETLAGTDTFRPGFKFDHPVEFVGFTLTMDTASATAEDLEIHVDANRGAAWDVKLYDKPMNTVKDIVKKFSDGPEQIIIETNDIVYFTWGNTNDRLWGLTIETKRLD